MKGDVRSPKILKILDIDILKAKVRPHVGPGKTKRISKFGILKLTSLSLDEI